MFHPASKNRYWVTFTDTGSTLNEYGEKTWGSSLIGSAYCVVLDSGTKTRRAQEGVFEEEGYEVHCNNNLPVVENRTRATIFGSSYVIRKKYNSRAMFGTMFMDAVRTIG